MILHLLALIALDPERVIALEGETYHVQGIVLDGPSRIFVTSVDKAARKGFLFEYELPSGKRLRSIEIQDGDRYHPGGLDATADALWIPVAEYRAHSTAVIQKRNKRTLALEAQFRVNDHIGCIAVSKNRLYGGNWDSRQIYEWTLNGRELARRNRVSHVSDVSDVSDDVSYQDIKLRHGVLVGSGVRANGTGAVDFLDPRTLTTKRTVEFSKTDRGVLYTHEGMDFDGKRFYMLPEDGPSRLFVFQLP